MRRKGVASNEMCTFLIMNISSLQLIPNERDRISKSVWKREPGGNRRRGDFSYGGKYGGCSHILQNSGAKAKEIWYNQGEQISGKEQEICIKNSMCKIVSAADSTGV